MANPNKSELIKITTLTEASKHFLWKQELKNALGGKGWWNIASGQDKRPTADASETDKKAIELWGMRDFRAKSIITGSLSETLKIQAIVCDSAKNMIDK